MTDNPTDNRREAVEWAEESEDGNTLALTHALLYVGDVLADIRLELAKKTDTQSEGQPDPTSKLAKLLQKPSPFVGQQPEPGRPRTGNYQRFATTHNPADWTKLPDGRWQSPTGRKYQPWTKQVFGVVTARRKLGLSI